MTNPPMLLEIHHLNAVAGSTTILHDVSLSMPAGQRLAIIGPSGAGKTTLLRCIAGLTKPQSGQIKIDGREVCNAHRSVAPSQRGVSMVFQNYALWPHLTVYDHLRLVVSDAGEIPTWIQRVRLDGLEQRRPAQLSGGEQARLALARALVARPPLLLMDEPFRNLDPHLARELKNELRAVFDELSLGVILVTHDQHEAFTMAHEVAILRDGQLVAKGAPRDLYRSPRHPAVAEFLGTSMALAVSQYDGDTAATCLGPVRVLSSSSNRHRGAKLLLRPEDLEIEADPSGNACIVRQDDEGASRLLQLRVGPEEFLVRIFSDLSVQTGDRVQARVRRPLAPWPEAELATSSPDSDS